MAANSSPGTGRKDALTGILQSSLSPKYLHTNSTSHTWPFSAIAELIDNAYDPDVKASQLWIDKLQLGGKTCLTFTDNGNGMTTEKLHKMLSFGFCEKVPDGSHMPVGHYGNGFKSGSMRLGRDALVLTKQENSRSIGYLSQTYLEYIQAETVVVPIATWDKKDEKFVLRPDGSKALGDIVKYSLVHSDDELSEQFNLIPGAHGTRIVISNIRKTADNKPEFDFITDEYDIRIPDDANTEGGKYRQTKRQNHIPECDYSLKAYCAILYLKPKMQIILRGKKVKTLVVEKSLSKTEVDRYKPQGLLEPVKVVFGFNSRNKNHYGIMMYHRNRLIKPYERVGHQLKANNLGVGVVGVVQCDFLQPTHNKQDFDYTKSYRSCMNALGIKLNEYWNEKKGPARSTNNQLPIPEPQELQSLPDQTWVQCDKPSCLKWRKLPDGIDPDSLPDKWYCNMNPDPNYKSCDVPEEKDDDINFIQPYAKVQKKRLEKELQEKSRREKALKMAMLREQEEKKRELDEKERSLKQKEEELKRQYAALEDSKPKIKIEGQSKLPTAQVPPRPTTTKPYSAVTPTANQSTNHVTRSNQSTGSPVRPAQSAPFQVKIRPPSASHATNQLHPRAAPTNQSTPRALVSSQSASSNTPTNQSLRQALSNRLAQRTSSSGTQYTTLRPKPVESNSSSIKLVAKTTPGQLASRLTFKVMKSADGNTFLVQEKSGRTANAPNASPTLAKPGGNATPTPQKLVPVGMTPPSRDSTNATTNATVDIKPKLPIVLPKSQSSVTSSGVGRPGNDRVCYISPTTQSRGVEITNKTVTGSSLRDALTKANPAATVPASSFPRIVDAVSAAVTPPEDKKPVQIGVKRERGDDVMISPTPKKKVDAVIVIDPLPSETSQTNGKTKSVPESRLRELEVEWKEQMEKLQKQLKENSAQLAVKTAQLNQKTVKLNETSSILNERIIELKTMKSDVDQLTKDVEVKTTKLNDKTKQLKSLRTNVCKLLQVLVPEIDVESEEGSGEGETVDELLRQVLEANQ